MGGRFCILGSSSAGNCALLQTGETRVLIDAGFSARRIKAMLESIGESIDSIDAVFLTHEHHDHCAGMVGLSARADLPIFANRDTARAIQSKLKRQAKWHVFETGKPFAFRDLSVDSFSVPHDAHDPVGFTFHWGEDDLFSRRQGLAWVTDLGYVPELVRERIRAVETLVLESNYDEELLQRDVRRPWSLKQRIQGRHGHLSNNAAFELIDSIGRDSAWKRVHLAHLSKDCNCPSRVNTLYKPSLSAGLGFSLSVVDPAAAAGCIPTTAEL